jgi:hypothetical protein
MKSVVATDSSNNFFVGWTLAGSTWLLTHTDSLKLLFLYAQSVLLTKCDFYVHSSSYITDVNILYTHITWCSFKFVLYLRQTLIFCLSRHLWFNVKRRVSSHCVAKTTTFCICMWKLSLIKYGNTHLISELYYKIGRWFIFRKIIMFSVPLGSSSRAVSPIFEK